MSEHILPVPFDSLSNDPLAAAKVVRGLPVCRDISHISPEGCCVRLAGTLPKVGTWIIVQSEAMEPTAAVVRWIAGDVMGVEFERRSKPARRNRRGSPLDGMRLA